VCMLCQVRFRCRAGPGLTIFIAHDIKRTRSE
jgi:hypothetical protein